MSESHVDLDFSAAFEALRSWPDSPAAPERLSTPVRRLLTAAAAAQVAPMTVGAPDLAALLRHVLRTEAERTGANKWLPVPTEPPWPQEWEPYSMSSAPGLPRRRVFADAWSPRWLDCGEADPARAALAGEHNPPLGEPESTVADPFLSDATGLPDYRSDGQRQTIRAVLASPPAATVIGNLPTGSGKSMAGYVQALTSTTPGTTVVIVPTTSLAIDQERAFRELVARGGHAGRFPGLLSYYGELPAASRAEIRRQVADGAQGILFTSPESLIGSLSSALYHAARRGYLRALVIDEAHIVSQWGAEFRPAFQALSGVRRDLLDAAKNHGFAFRTILLSATLTSESVFTLQRLFGHPGPTELISAVTLRHEPSYWVAPSPDLDTRAERVLESVRHLPRPLILYTTKVDDAKWWRERLHTEGYRRVTLVAGETSAEERSQAIQQLRNGSLDIVVATSAFGLGVDQPDVRAVVHACLPETIDRFYQEVGRGGRDGQPSVSMLLPAPSDHAIADALAHTKLISLDRGFQRWRSMSVPATSLNDNRLRVPLDVSPPDIPGDSSENRAWNMRTLLLMSRAGLLTLEATPPPRRDEEESEDSWTQRAPDAFEAYSRHAVVRLEHGSLADPGVFDAAVAPARDAARTADREARERMTYVLNPDTQFCELLTETYSIAGPIPAISDSQLPVRVGGSCGGCPGCRVRGLPPRRFPAPRSAPAAHGGRRWDAKFEPWFAGQSVLVATYNEERDWLENVVLALESLTRRGLWCVAAPPNVLANSRVHGLYQHAVGHAIFQASGWNWRTAADLPTTVVVAPAMAITPQHFRPGGVGRVLVVSELARDPRHASSTVGEYHQPVVTVRDLIERR